jgi:hypothetical protein
MDLFVFSITFEIISSIWSITFNKSFFNKNEFDQMFHKHQKSFIYIHVTLYNIKLRTRFFLLILI